MLADLLGGPALSRQLVHPGVGFPDFLVEFRNLRLARFQFFREPVLGRALRLDLRPCLGYFFLALP
jgi:hypothetical protein